MIATTVDKKLHGFEVTELVDTDTARRVERDNVADFKQYSKAELVTSIDQRVQRKSLKSFKTACDESFLLIYSDEPDLHHGSGYPLLADISTRKSEIFSEIWFMIPPDINISGGEPKNPYCQIFPVRQT